MTKKLHSLEQAIQWAGFRELTPAEAASGPFARQRGEKRYIRFEPAACFIAFVRELEGDAAVIPFLDQLGQSAWGYDLNLDQRAASTETVNEFWFVIAPDAQSAPEELRWLGYQQQCSIWVRCDSACSVPALDPGHGGEIFPCLGWVPAPCATSEWETADQRPGFCSKTVPQGAQSIRDVRGYHFIYGGYAERIITRRRIIAFIDPSEPESSVTALVADALALTYGAA